MKYKKHYCKLMMQDTSVINSNDLLVKMHTYMPLLEKNWKQNTQKGKPYQS